jgi:phosphate transport system permease protein
VLSKGSAFGAAFWINKKGVLMMSVEEQESSEKKVGEPKAGPQAVGFVFTQENLKKKFRLSEFLSEKIITGVAFLSIAIIFLIFMFVFKEALPIFSAKKEKKTEITSSSAPERYGEESVTSQEAKPERYDGGEAESRPERYGIEEDTSLTDTQQSDAFSQDSLLSGNRINPVEGSDDATFKSLTSKSWMPVSDNPKYGLVPLVVGTIKITLIAILFAAPIAILAALFSAAFAPKWLREIIKPAIELLAGFPSVVIGFFALMVMASFFQDTFGYDTRLNAFVGGVAMALAAIPIIFTVTEDAMTAIPATYTEASLALGATKWQTAFYVVLPAATPGIFAAVLLGIGRIFGETMIALMATGNAAMISANPFDSVRTLAATIGAEMAEVVFGDTHYNVLFLIGALLFVFTFLLNSLAEFYVKGKLMRRFQGRTS